MPGSSHTYDAIIVGGGPAGSAAAARLARAGRSVLVVERERFPRFHVGESLLPLTNEALSRIGLDPEGLDGEFVPKWGATFSSADGSKVRHADFAASSEVRRPRTFQVLRERFDELLLRHAARVGAEVRQGVRATDVVFRPDGVRLTVQPEGLGSEVVRASFLVDASGQAGFLSKRLGLRQSDMELRNVAAYGHFRGVPRQTGRRSGDIRVIAAQDMGWLWFIPLRDGVTSVGAVVPRRVHDRGARVEAAEALARVIRATPAARALMEGATPCGPARYEADFAYAPRAYAGPRWLLAGDAGSFLDPVFSTGVLLALEAGSEAADAIEQALARGRPGPALRRYERLQRRRFEFFRRFVAGFYDPAFRDVFFHPVDRFGLFRSVVTILAGTSRPSLRTRAGIALFFGIVALQRHVALVERGHGGAATPPLGTAESLEV